MRISARVDSASMRSAYSDWYRFSAQRMERAMLIGADQATRGALRETRERMASAGLGRMGQALEASSDLSRGRGVHRGADGYVSASGMVSIRSGSQRSRGAIEAYTQGAEIRPVRGKWLWIATDQIPRKAGRFRMTPELYQRNGFDRKIGPLVLAKGSNGFPILIVKNVGVSAAGLARSAKALRRNGMPRRGQAAKDFIIAFYAIPRTAREARIDAPEIFQRSARQAVDHFYDALGRI